MPQYVVLEDAYLSEDPLGAGRVYKQGEFVNLPHGFEAPAHLRAVTSDSPAPAPAPVGVPATVVAPNGQSVPVVQPPPDPNAPQVVDSTDLA